MTEADLVARARDGDVAAFEALYRSHVGRVYGLCLRMLADPSRAEDLTQETFVRAWEKLPSFRGQSAFATWLHRLSVNLVLGDLRRRSRRREQRVEPPQLEAVPDADATREPFGEIDLERAICGLPPQARMVFVLHDVEGFQHAEIAELAGIAEGTSKAHLHRARRILRKALEP